VWLGRWRDPVVREGGLLPPLPWFESVGPVSLGRRGLKILVAGDITHSSVLVAAWGIAQHILLVVLGV